MAEVFKRLRKKQMNPIKKRLSLEEFKEYVNKKDFGELPPTFLVLHHTWRPTVKSWNGKSSIDGLDKYYRGLGWQGNGPHLFIAEDGIWLFTDMYEVGIHAGVGNGTLKTGYSIGIEVVGNYDNKVWSGETKKNTVGAIKVLMKTLKLDNDDIKFHRDYSSKSCPGNSITKDWVYKQLTETKMEKKYQEFYDSKESSKGADTIEEWVKLAYDYRADREDLEKDNEDLKDENAKLTDSYRTLVIEKEKMAEAQSALTKAHDFELTKLTNSLTEKYNANLDILQREISIQSDAIKGQKKYIEELEIYAPTEKYSATDLNYNWKQLKHYAGKVWELLKDNVIKK